MTRLKKYILSLNCINVIEYNDGDFRIGDFWRLQLQLTSINFAWVYKTWMATLYMLYTIYCNCSILFLASKKQLNKALNLKHKYV